MANFAWPGNLQPFHFGLYHINADTSGGANIGGGEQFVASPGPRWGASMTLPIYDVDGVYSIRALRSQLQGRANGVILPNFDQQRAPWPGTTTRLMTPRRQEELRLAAIREEFESQELELQRQQEREEEILRRELVPQKSKPWPGLPRQTFNFGADKAALAAELQRQKKAVLDAEARRERLARGADAERKKQWTEGSAQRRRQMEAELALPRERIDDEDAPSLLTITATVNATVAARATQIAINKTDGGTIKGGMQFEIAQRIYEIATVVSTVGAVTTVNIQPPLRAQATAGTAVDFEDPRCVMRCLNLNEETRQLEWLRYATLNLEFVELL